MRTANLLAIVCVLGACTTAPIVYAPNDLRNGPATGFVPPLRGLAAQVAAIRLVLIHGVGDHCHGYALDPDHGWLRNEVTARIGLHPAGDLSPLHTIYTNVFMGGIRDDRSYVQYSVRPFELTLEGLDPIPAEAIELTWSHTTQWAKSNYLGYDSPSVTPPPGGMSAPCVEAPDGHVEDIKSPPARLLVDRMVKEQVFDRNLADAILYAGSYGALMEKAVAEALCHAVTHTPDDRACAWPPPVESPPGYFFVTHSLGSRIIYDTILNLLGVTSGARPNPFGSPKDPEPFVSQMLAQTKAFYMMANQLAMLGLANLPTDARSDELLRPLDIDTAQVQRAAPGPTPAVTPQEAARPCTTILGKLGAARVEVARRAGKTEASIPALELIAFNDTNDLLTWHIPAWYVDDTGPRPGDCHPHVHLVNVFVRNTARWLVLESPAPAHENYFTRAEVWRTIACGAADGVVPMCAAAGK